MRADRAKHRDKRQAGDRKRYRGDPGKIARQNMARYYGLTTEQVDAVFQQDICQLCEEPRGDRRFYVDHCHTTGQNRGVICNRCNLALGHMRDSAPLARRMADYIERGGFGFFGENQNG